MNFEELWIFISFYSCSDGNSPANSANSVTKEMLGQKFTTSNFTETVVVNSDSVFGGSKTGPNVPVVKKRKLDSSKLSSTISASNEELNR